MRLNLVLKSIFIINFSVNVKIHILQGTNSNGLFYEAPSFDIKNSNVTFGGGLFSVTNNPRDPLIKLGETIAAICQADQINQKRTSFSFNGTINLVFQEYDSEQSSGQGAIVGLIEENLQGIDSYKLKRQYRANITGLFGSSDYGTAKVNSLSSNDFGIPFIDAGDLGRDENDNFVSSSSLQKNKTFFQILDTSQYNTFTAVLDLAEYFNWTLLGSVFEANAYGYSRQRDIIYQSYTNSSLIFACNYLFYLDNVDGGKISTGVSSLLDYCKCINQKDTMSITILWMTATNAAVVIQNIRNTCTGTDSWTYIIADDFESSSPEVAQYSAQYLKNSLLIRNFGPWDFKSFLTNCLDTATPEAKSVLVPIVDKLVLNKYSCQVSQREGHKECTIPITDRKISDEPCHCDLSIFDQDPYSSKYLFSADIMSVYASGISLLQNNCSYLNSLIPELPVDKKFDFCSLKKFLPEDLAFAVRNANLSGYSGSIYFPSDNVLRAIKSYYLYSVYNNTFDAMLVGILNKNGVQINVSAIQFVNDEVPVSEIVPQNIDLSYAVADVFFGIAIAEVILSLLILVFYIVHRNNSHIRKSSFPISLAMLIGVIICAVGQITFSLGATDALCIVTLYLYRTGIMLIASGLLVKNYRIYRIFGNKTASAINISETRLLLAMLLITLAYMMMITIMIAIDGFGAELKYGSDNIYYQYINCSSTSEAWNIIFNIALIVGFAFVLIPSIVFAWLTRNVHSDFRETSALSAFAIVIVGAFIIYFSLGYTYSNETDSELFRYIITAEFITIIAISALILLFIPKVYVIICQKRKLKRRQSTLQ